MLLKRSATLLIALASLTACNEDANKNTATPKAQYSVLGSLRPKADPAVVEQIRQEEIQKAQAAQEAAVPDGGSGSGSGFFNFGGLPKVETGPISGGLGESPKPRLPGGSSATSDSPPPITAKSDSSSSGQPSTNGNPFWPFGQPQNNSPPPQQAASYGGYGSSSSGSGGLIPPPPAVSLSAQGQLAPPPQYAMAPQEQYNPYAYNPYAIPPGAVGQPPPQPQPQRLPSGSMFGNQGEGAPAGGGEEPKPKKADIQVITPTGMEPRSPYKQRDDLKVLFNGALAVNGLAGANCRDPRIAQDVAKIQVGLPAEGTKGSAAIGQRQIDMLFKGTTNDKKLLPLVKKIETEMAQSYYRFLYSFNKYALAQQTVAARKQEVSVAESNAEKQRAAADLAKAQEEAESTKDDMKSAQNDLAGVAGAPAARNVIQRVAGVAPSLDSLAQAEPQAAAPTGGSKVLGSVGGWFGGMGGMIGLGGKKPAGGDTADGDEQVAKVAKVKPEKAEKDKDKDKDKDKKDKKGKGGKGAVEVAAKPVEAPKAAVEEPEEKPAPAAGGSVAFELKDVQTTPRKSVLRVAIRNNGDEQFTFNPDVVSVAEGDKKLTDAAVRADFDSTVVGPNQEVTGTITIYGKPWTDKLKVSLSEGGRTIHMHR